MIKKLVISAVVLTALIAGKEAHATGLAGFARSLASSQALQIHTAEVPAAKQQADNEAVLTLTFAKRRELLRINAAVNGAIDAVDSYIDGFAGDLAFEFGNADCFDCADVKRNHLAALGWSEKAMRIAYSVGSQGQVERVLVIATDRGDVILGNESATIDMPVKPAAKQARDTGPTINRAYYDI